MISNNLKVFLLIVTLIYFIIILISIKNQKIPIKSSILWIIFGVLMVICIFAQPILIKICDLIGIEKVSNLLLFCGFMAMLILVFDLYKLNYELKRKNIILSQEISVLKNEIKRK